MSQNTIREQEVQFENAADNRQQTTGEGNAGTTANDDEEVLKNNTDTPETDDLENLDPDADMEDNDEDDDIALELDDDDTSSDKETERTP